MSARVIKRHYKLDHNTSPREDIQKYGTAMVKEGKLSRTQLDREKWQSAHENCVEGYALFVAGSVSFAFLFPRNWYRILGGS
jgi:hypothetical protein